ncbi:MAG: hypothetical protein P8101_00140, partial [Candidatus Thiodiazotropha sp.]
MQLKSRVVLILLLIFLILLTFQMFLDALPFQLLLPANGALDDGLSENATLMNLLSDWVDAGLWRKLLLFSLGLGLLLWAIYRWLERHILSPLRRSQDILLSLS